MANGQDALWDTGGDDRPDPVPAGHTFTVAQLTNAIRDAMGVLFPGEVWVEGEIASLSTGRTRESGTPGSRHVYFDLVAPGVTDAVGTADATLPVVLFDTHRRRVNEVLREQGSVKMGDGVRVRIRGRVDFYPPQARVQLKMTSIDPVFTVGVLASERERVLAGLAADRLLDANRSLALALMPERIGLITSFGSAAEADFLHELGASGIAWSVTAIDAPMQGGESPTRVVAALQTLDARSDIDIVAVVRGGGARTDLAAFDDERIARAIAAMRTPVFTGIGHEVDTSVADAVAAVASKTPTACAAVIVRRARSWVDRAVVAGAALGPAASQALASAGSRHSAVAARVGSTASGRIAVASSRIEQSQRRLTLAPTRAIGDSDRHLASAAATIRALDPQRTLDRGYTVTRSLNGGLVRVAGDVAPGEALVTTTSDGDVASIVS